MGFLENINNLFSAGSGFDWYTWVILPIIVFVARVCDVTLGTIRIIFISRGRHKVAPILGFFEVFIWIVIIAQLVQNIHSIPAYFGYAGGFAAGNYVGMWLEEKLALGTYLIRTIIMADDDLLEKEIHNSGYGATRVYGEGSSGAVKIIYTIVRRANVEQVMGIIHKHKPNAFVSIEEVRSAEHGIFPKSVLVNKPLFPLRKSK